MNTQQKLEEHLSEFESVKTAFYASQKPTQHGCTCRVVMTNAGTPYMRIDVEPNGCPSHPTGASFY